MAAKKKCKERSYAILREGANGANQSMTQSMIVDIVKACSRKAAVEKASPKIKTYANQYLRALPRSMVSSSEWNSYLEDEAALLETPQAVRRAWGLTTDTDEGDW